MLARISDTHKNTRTKDIIMHEQRENNAQNKITLYPTNSLIRLLPGVLQGE